jgi:hypothetical protein
MTREFRNADPNKTFVIAPAAGETLPKQSEELQDLAVNEPELIVHKANAQPEDGQPRRESRSRPSC